ncbi:MAG: hypothetical protein QM811_26195 [Pirellulales bacterium]
MQVMVGFNRRFSPHAVALRKWLSARGEPATIHMLINAGQIPADNWIMRPEVSGGRIVGEGCHWFDLAAFLVDAPISAVTVDAGGSGDRGRDHQTITLALADGSTAVLQYLVNGSKAFPKERVTIFCQGQVAELDNFHSLATYDCKGLAKQNLWKQDKGHRAEVAAFLASVAGGGRPVIPFESLVNTTLATFAALRARRTAQKSKSKAEARRPNPSPHPVDRITIFEFFSTFILHPSSFNRVLVLRHRRQAHRAGSALLRRRRSGTSA